MKKFIIIFAVIGLLFSCSPEYVQEYQEEPVSGQIEVPQWLIGDWWSENRNEGLRFKKNDICELSGETMEPYFCLKEHLDYIGWKFLYKQYSTDSYFYIDTYEAEHSYRVTKLTINSIKVEKSNFEFIMYKAN